MQHPEQKHQSLLSIIVPIYNEEKVLPELQRRLTKVCAELPCSTEIICVDDGSTDASLPFLIQWAEKNPQLKIISFTRNFGHQNALTAGMDFCKGDAAVTMDADLQDPPEIIPQMYARFEEGFAVVLAQRSQRHGEHWLKRCSAFLFYRIMKKMMRHNFSPDCGDFRLLSRPALDALRSMRESHRFLRGMVAWLGYKESILPFDRSPRFAGNTHYSIRRMFNLAWDATLSFSTIPLRLSIYLGFSVALFGLCYGIFAIYHAWIRQDVVPGWTSVVVLLCLLSGITMFCVGIAGEYVGKIFEEIKGRPLYIAGFTRNFSEQNLGEPSRKRN
jgi:glycosyltransferase involved in cell wall biosynthesis